MATDPQDISTLAEPVAGRLVDPSAVAETPMPVGPNKAGKIAAIVAACVMVVGIAAVAVVMVSVRDLSPVKIERVTESVDSTDGCEWRLVVELYNNSEEPLTVSRIGAVLNRGRHGGTRQEAPALAPGSTGTYLARFRLPPSDVCPTAEEINHGNLIFYLADGSSESVRF